MRWRWQLQGDRADLEQLVTMFDDYPVRVVLADETFWLESSEIPAETEADDARVAAIGALHTLNGIAALKLPGSGRVSIGRQERVEPSGRADIWIIPEPAPLTLRLGIPTILIDGKPLPSSFPRIVEAARDDRDVEHVLRMYGSRALDMRDLYVIVEAIEANIRPATLQTRGWLSRNQRQRIRRTADSRQVLGPAARHGTEDKQPPANPISLPDARRVVGSIVERWLREKLDPTA